MNDTNFDNFIKSLGEKWQGNKQCPICQNNTWGISDKLAELREFHHGDIIMGGQVYPLIVLSCKVCGYIHLFNAILAGLIDPKTYDATSPVESVQSKLENKKENEP